MKSSIIKRSVVIAGHKTSVSLEDAFWKGLKEIAGGRDMTLSDLVDTIDCKRQHGNLSSAIRLFVLDFFMDQTCNINAQRDGKALSRPPLFLHSRWGHAKANDSMRRGDGIPISPRLSRLALFEPRCGAGRGGRTQ
jgi:predicted DNA-binding ribbon-helix-helix protein